MSANQTVFGRAAEKPCPADIRAPSAIVIEVSTGAVACSRDADRRRPIASTTKLMTALLTLERAKLSDTFTAARYYQVGAAGKLNVDRLPFTGFDKTCSVKPDGKPDYDPDSASAGTMWATGQKTLDERISQGPTSAITLR